MGIPVDLWRARIGSLSPGMKRLANQMAAITLTKDRVHAVRILFLLAYTFIGIVHTPRQEPLTVGPHQAQHEPFVYYGEQWLCSFMTPLYRTITGTTSNGTDTPGEWCLSREEQHGTPTSKMM